jgi:hypothetical protein
MAFESIPLNWETLSLLGGVGTTAAGAGWKAAQMLGNARIRELEAKGLPQPNRLKSGLEATYTEQSSVYLRVSASQAECRGFDSLRPLHT